MTDTTPAAELRAAATKLRQSADKTESGFASALREGTRDLFGKAVPDPAAMYPPVGRALAGWMESTALTVDAVAKHRPDAVIEDENAHWLMPALAVARQILGTAR